MLTESQQKVLDYMKANNNYVYRTDLRKYIRDEELEFKTVDDIIALNKLGYVSYDNPNLALILNDPPFTIDPGDDAVANILNWLNNDKTIVSNDGVFINDISNDDYYLGILPKEGKWTVSELTEDSLLGCTKEVVHYTADTKRDALNFVLSNCRLG